MLSSILAELRANIFAFLGNPYAGRPAFYMESVTPWLGGLLLFWRLHEGSDFI